MTRPAPSTTGGPVTPPWEPGTNARLSRPRDEAAAKLLIRHLNDTLATTRG